jgi:hypothetical protein
MLKKEGKYLNQENNMGLTRSKQNGARTHWIKCAASPTARTLVHIEKMKWIILIFLLLSIKAESQNLMERNPQTFQMVSDLKKSVTMDSVVINGFLEHACNGSELKLIIKSIKGNFVLESSICKSFGCESYLYHYVNDKLVYVEEFFDQYVYDEEKEEIRLDEIERNFHGQYIFKDGFLIDFETLGHNRFEDDEIDIEETIVTEAKEKLELIN